MPPPRSSITQLAKPPASVTTTAEPPSPKKQSVKPEQMQEKETWCGPSNISMFLTNLRLLGLEELPDWPHITLAVFSTKDANQNQKNRLRCVEWSLYRLFEIWDPAATNNKLRPFFPPQEPLQSLNLRAALVKWLTDLKKDGALGKETLVRKTMLDECKGERFEEILLVFSNAVLRKKALDDDEWRFSIAARLATAPTLSDVEKGNLIPLILAHRASLARVLKQRNELAQQYEDFEQLLEFKKNKIRLRYEEVKESKVDEEVETDIDIATARQVRRLWEDNWIGDARWTEVLLHGDASGKQDGLLSAPFDEVWQSVNAGEVTDFQDRNTKGLLECLNERVEEQRNRLQYWQKIHADLVKEAETTPDEPTETGNQQGLGFNLGFNQHEDLQFSNASMLSDDASLDQDLPANDAYASIIASMKDELNAVEGTDATGVEDENTQTPRRDSGRRETARQIESDDQSIDDTNPFGETRSHEEIEKVTARQAINQDEHVVNDSPASSGKGKALHEEVDNIPKSSGSEDIDITPIVGRFKRSKNDRVSLYNADEQDEFAGEIVNYIANASPSPVKPPLSLAERTRMSMAGIDSSRGTLPDVPVLKSEPPEKNDGSVSSSESQPEDALGPATLIERTRQSMSLLPPASSRRRTIQKPPRPSFPVNQFEPSEGPDQNEEIENRLPKKAVLDANADYESVFKSRPKIAVSPSLSPSYGDTDLPSVKSVLHREVEDDEYYDTNAGWASSPLAKASQRANGR